MTTIGSITGMKKATRYQPVRSTLHRHQAGEREPDGHLEHQGGGDVDEGVDVRRSVDVVLERSGEVVEADELDLVGARPAVEAEPDRPEHREPDDEREERDGGSRRAGRPTSGYSVSTRLL